MTTSADIARHRYGVRQFLPWALRLLAGQARRPHHGEELRAGRASDFPIEVVERVFEAMPLAVVRFLTYAGGWRGASVPRAGRVVDGVRVSDGRVWDALELGFTEHSFAAVVEAQQWRQPEFPVRLPGEREEHEDRAWTAGDLIVCHLVRFYMQRDTHAPIRLRHDPLSAMGGLARAQASEADAAEVFDHLEPVLPWLTHHLADCWGAIAPRVYNTAIEAFGDPPERLTMVMRHWRRAAVARERLDLLRPLILVAPTVLRTALRAGFGGDHLPRLDEGPFEERQARYQRYTRPLHELMQARRVYHELRATPPIDREAAGIIYMRECEAGDLETTWQRIDSIIATLENRIQ